MRGIDESYKKSYYLTSYSLALQKRPLL